jgi:glycosyltransferase involved in cell wall biosynthesis
MKILYLYTEVMGYNLPIFDRLASHYGASVDVFHWNKNKLTPFTPEHSEGVTFHPRSAFSIQEMTDFAVKLHPDVVYISGWQDKGYLAVVRKLKSLGIPIVAGLDSQWTGSLRQQIGAQLIRWVYKPRYFSYVWVPGPMQYAYASRIGFKKTEILSNLLSGNSAVFASAAREREKTETSALTSRDSVTPYLRQSFLYVGRFAQAKGIDVLINAYRLYKQKYQGTWTLTCIGNGPMQEDLLKQKDIQIESFLTQTELAKRASSAGAFVLPSRYEPWGVVVHEFATAGLPLILSECVGARPQFLIDEANGYTFYENSAEELAHKMYQMSNQSPEALKAMGQLSAKLAEHITPEIAAASLMSVVRKRQA